MIRGDRQSPNGSRGQRNYEWGACCRGVLADSLDLYYLAALYEVGVDGDAEARAVGAADDAVFGLERGGRAVDGEVGVAFELHVGADVGCERGEVDDVHVAEAAAGHVGDDRQAGRRGHAGDLGGADEAATVMQVGLNDVAGPLRNAVLPAM